MALTENTVREILSEAGCAAENIETAMKKIMSGHVTSINALREQRDAFKADAEKLPTVQKELDDLKAKGDPNWEKKFEEKNQELENFKATVAAEKEKEKKISLFSSFLENDCMIDKSRIPSIVNVTKFDEITLKDNKLDDAENLKQKIQDLYSGFVLTKKTEGAPVETPPGNNGGEKNEQPSRAAELQQKYRENIYGKKEN